MKVLVADDNPVTRRMVLEQMRGWGYEPIIATDGQEAWTILQSEDAPSLAILDWMMPGLEGIEVCRRLRAARTMPYTYVIMLTSRDRTEDLVAAIDAGADDFLTKPCDKQELRVRLRAGQRIVELEELLRYKATHDPLTGICNRALILETLQREMARATRSGQETGICLLDVDYFKRINDRFGHPVGDEVLKDLCPRLRSFLRPFDSLGRYGGEEFLVVLPECSASEALDVAHRLRCGVNQQPMGPVSVTVSIGVTVIPPGTTGADTYLKAADEALYRAKAEGRDRVVVA